MVLWTWVGLSAVAPALWSQPAEPRVTEIEIRGLKHVPEHTVRDVMQTKVGEIYSQETFERDLETIADLGFFQENGVSALFPEEQEGGGIKLVIEVVENPVIRGVKFSGNELFPDEELAEQLQFLRKGTVLNWLNVERDFENIDNYYQKHDYLGVARYGDPLIDEEGILQINISEIRVHEVRFKGLGKTKPIVLKREMQTQPGSYFSRRRVSEDLRTIYNLDFFEHVEAENPYPAPDKLDEVDVVIQVKEKQTGHFGAGAGYSSRYGLVGFADVGETNFKGMGRQVRTHLEFGGRQSYELSLVEPWLDRRHTSLALDVYDTLEERDSFFPSATGTFSRSRYYDQQRRGFRLTFGRPLDLNTRVHFGLKSETTKTTRPLSGQAVPSLPPFPFQGLGSDSTRSLTLSFDNDTRDVFIDASTGARYSFNLEFAGGPFGGDNRFTKWGFDVRHYRPMGKKAVLAHRLQVGLSGGQLPFSQVYFVGGADTLRGYEEDRFFGNRMFLFNLEYRYRFQENMQGVLFYDAGRAWRETESMSIPGDLVGAFGFGIRVKTPLGPLRLDYGFGREGGRMTFGFAQQF